MIFQAGRKRVAVALVALLVLVTQSLALAGAAPVRLDAFGNPLCIGDHVDPGSRHGDPLKPDDCCTLACAGWTASPLAPPETVLQADIFRLVSEPIRTAVAVSVSPWLDGGQGKPRAPPSAS